MPTNMPWITAGETARNHWPSLSKPAANWINPASSTITPSMGKPWVWTNCQTSTVKPAAGPLTCNGEPAKKPTTKPPMMPVIIPAVGGTPVAIEIPMHRGRATKNTTTDACASWARVARRSAEGINDIGLK